VAGGSSLKGIRGRFQRYLALRGEGLQDEKDGLMLDSLARHLEAAGLATVDRAGAVEWAMLPQDGAHRPGGSRGGCGPGLRPTTSPRQTGAEIDARGCWPRAQPAPALHFKGREIDLLTQRPGSTAGT